MQSLGSSLKGFRRLTPSDGQPAVAERPPLDDLRRMPETRRLLELLACDRVALDQLGPSEDGRLVAALRERINRHEGFLPLARQRDRIQAARPAECWCLGEGGTQPRAVLVDLTDADPPLVLGVYCTCPEADARRLVDDQFREQARLFSQQARVSGLWRTARIPERFATCTFDTFPGSPETATAVEVLRGWLDTDGWGLVLTGPFGIGKTGLAIAALRVAMEQKRLSGLFVKATDLLAHVRDTYGKSSENTEEQVLASLRTVGFLVIDDMGTDKATDWSTSLLFQVLDSRHDENRKTLLTTNLNLRELETHLGKRTLERFREGGGVLPMAGPNLRLDGAA